MNLAVASWVAVVLFVVGVGVWVVLVIHSEAAMTPQPRRAAFDHRADCNDKIGLALSFALLVGMFIYVLTLL